MKKISILFLILFISVVNVKADYREAQERKASENYSSNIECNKETTQKVSVKAVMPSTYYVSIPKETQSEIFIKVSGDIAGNERIHLSIDNIDKYINWNEMGKTFKFNKTKETNYRITLEEEI